MPDPGLQGDVQAVTGRTCQTWATKKTLPALGAAILSDSTLPHPACPCLKHAPAYSSVHALHGATAAPQPAKAQHHTQGLSHAHLPHLQQHLPPARGRSCTSARRHRARCCPQCHAASATVPAQHHIWSPLQQLLVSSPLPLARCLQRPHWVQLPDRVPESGAAGTGAAFGSTATHVLQGAGQAKVIQSR